MSLTVVVNHNDYCYYSIVGQASMSQTKSLQQRRQKEMCMKLHRCFQSISACRILSSINVINLRELNGLSWRYPEHSRAERHSSSKRRPQRNSIDDLFFASDRLIRDRQFRHYYSTGCLPRWQSEDETATLQRRWAVAPGGPLAGLDARAAESSRASISFPAGSTRERGSNMPFWCATTTKEHGSFPGAKGEKSAQPQDRRSK